MIMLLYILYINYDIILNEEGVYMKARKNIGNVQIKVSNSKVNNELLMALNESKKIIHDMETGKSKGFNNIDELFKSLDS